MPTPAEKLDEINKKVNKWSIDQALDENRPEDKAFKNLLMDLKVLLNKTDVTDKKLLSACLMHLLESKVSIERQQIIPRSSSSSCLFGNPPSRQVAFNAMKFENYLQEKHIPIYERLLFEKPVDEGPSTTPAVIGSKHVAKLMDLYKAFYDLVADYRWIYEYPLDGVTGELRNQERVNEWQRTMMTPGGYDLTSDGAFPDYKRDTMIDGRKLFDTIPPPIAVALNKLAEDVKDERLLRYTIQILRLLVDKAFKEPQPTYHQEDKEMLVAWLREKGGQFNQRFFQDIIVDGALGKAYGLANSEANTLNWCIKDGHICLEMSISAYGMLDIEGLQVLVKEKEGREKWLDIVEARQLYDAKRLSPLLLIESRVTLAVEGQGRSREVVPKVTYLGMESYSDTLIKPNTVEAAPTHRRRP